MMKKFAGMALAGLFLATGAGAAVNDIFPGDYAALPQGVTVITAYFFDREYDSLYSQGQRVADGKLQSNVAAVRFVRYYRLGDYTVAPVAVLPYAMSHVTGDLRSALGDGSDGFVDARLGGTLWLVDNPQTRDYLGLTLITFIPTGDYISTRAVNAGENRWKTTLGLGGVHGISERWTLDVTPELAWYGANESYLGNLRLEQQPTYALTGYLRYRALPDTEFFVGGQVNGGGETEINGIAQKNVLHSRRALVGLTYSPSPAMQLIARYARETSTDNGLHLSNEVALRWTMGF
ncbi:MAG: transporter [Sulfuricellaceae bacterium]